MPPSQLNIISSQIRPFLIGRNKNKSHQHQPLEFWPSDPWPAKSSLGQFLLSGLNEYPAGFNAGVDAFWSTKHGNSHNKAHHDFSWLGDLKAMGGDQARQSARILVASWIERYGSRSKKNKNNSAYQEDSTVAKRILNLLYSYDFHGSSATDNYQSLISITITQDALYLYKKLSGSFVNVGGGKDYLLEAAALLSAGLCLGDKKDWCDIAEQILSQSLEVQILTDGGHVSRSPQKLTDILKTCLDLKRLHIDLNVQFPEGIQFSIDRMAQAVKFFRYTDKKLAVFNSGQESNVATLDLMLHQVGQNRKIVKSLPNSGFERLTQGRSIVMMDIGNVPPAPFDRKAHLAPLAFEFSHGKDRIIVNCGTHTKSHQWADSLRRTPAHSSLTINHRDVMDIKENNSIKNSPSQVIADRHEENSSLLLEAMHDGYVPDFGMKHVRRVYLSNKGQDFRGEDSIFSEQICDDQVTGEIRFHIHPKVRVSLIRHGASALLRLYSGSGWRFEQSGAWLSLEESVYMGCDDTGSMPIKTQQLVLSFAIDAGESSSQVKWAFQREQ